MTASQQPTSQHRAEELRAAARSLEEANAALANLAETPLPLEGDPQAFTREAAPDRTLVEGLDLLVEETARVSAILDALASAEERELDVPPVLLASVQPYLDAVGMAGQAAQSQERD